MQKLLLLILHLLPSLIFAQTPNRYFPLPGLPEYHFWGYCAPVVPTPDGGYLLNYGYGAPNIHAGTYGGDLIKTDSSFHSQWRVAINGESGRNAIGYPDGSTVVLGSGIEILLRKFDPQGNRIWDRRIYRGPYLTQVVNDLLGYNGKLVLAGYLATVDPFGLYTSTSPTVLELDTAGNFIGMDSIEVPGMTFPSVEAAGHDSAGNLYLSGSGQGGASGCWLAKLDTNHTAVWGYRFTTNSGLPVFKEIIALANGDILLGGWLNNNSTGDVSMALARVSPSGNLIWAETNYEISQVLRMMEKPDGHLIVTGNYRAANGDTMKVMVAEMDSAGSVVWAKTYTPGVAMGVPYMRSANEWVFPAMGEFHPMLLSTDSLGNSSCYMQHVSLNFYSITMPFNVQTFISHPVPMTFTPIVPDSIVAQPSIDSCYHVLPVAVVAPSGLSLEVFPNPCHGRFSLRAPVSMQAVEVRNALGQIVLQAEPAAKELEIALPEPGVYFVAVVAAEGSWTRKVSVLR